MILPNYEIENFQFFNADNMEIFRSALQLTKPINSTRKTLHLLESNSMNIILMQGLNDLKITKNS
jgi:hypothetical protein